jgi:hypothetical protein
LVSDGPAAEPLLLTLLNDPDDPVATAAAEALAVVGTSAAVQPLSQWSEGMFRAAGVKSAARKAIAAIQLRHGGAGPGGLALVSEETGGGLGLVDDGDAEPGA